MQSSNLFIFACLVIIESCSPGEKKTYSHLRIGVNKNANFYLDSIRLSAPYKYNGIKYEWDSVSNLSLYVFDSVKNGPLTLTFVSFLHRNFEKKIVLNSDSTIWISEKEVPNFSKELKGKKNLPELSLHNGDSLIIGLQSSGCFHNLREDIVIRRNNDRYSIDYNTPRLERDKGGYTVHLKKVYDSTFARQLDSFQKSCIDLFAQIKADAKKEYG